MRGELYVLQILFVQGTASGGGVSPFTQVAGPAGRPVDLSFFYQYGVSI